jgi:hypothetical protein
VPTPPRLQAGTIKLFTPDAMVDLVPDSNGVYGGPYGAERTTAPTRIDRMFASLTGLRAAGVQLDPSQSRKHTSPPDLRRRPSNIGTPHVRRALSARAPDSSWAEPSCALLPTRAALPRPLPGARGAARARAYAPRGGGHYRNG